MRSGDFQHVSTCLYDVHVKIVSCPTVLEVLAPKFMNPPLPNEVRISSNVDLLVALVGSGAFKGEIVLGSTTLPVLACF